MNRTGGLPKWRGGITLAVFFGWALLTVSPGASDIPYFRARCFAENPMMAEVTLPPLPDALHPMGPPKPLPTSIVSPLPPAEGPKNGPNTTTGLPPKTSHGETTVNGQVQPHPPSTSPDAPGSQDDTTVTTASPVPSSSFMNWVQHNPGAAATAQAERNSYKNPSQGPGQPDAANPDQDMMLNIQYPYLWNQEQPPGGGAVIYTIKK